MSQILIVYASDWGSTKKMVDAVAKGVVSVAGSKTLVKTAEEVGCRGFDDGRRGDRRFTRA